MRLTAVIVASALFMQNLDSTVVSTALPAMAAAFHADPLRMSAALTSYLLSLSVFIPASGWIADRYGPRNVFRAAIVVFTAGSILCGLANNLWFFVIARVVQGLGGAMMVPIGRLVLLRSVAKSELVNAMAWLTVPALVGPVVGPPLGGAIVTYASWRWIFGVNVPVGLLGVVLVTRFVADIRMPRPARFDAIGLVLSGLALCSLMAAVETVGRPLLPWPASLALAGLGLASGLLYLRHARRTAAPLLDLGLLRLPTFGISVAAGTLFRIGIGAIPFLLPLMLQLGFGKTALESGAITFAASAGALLMKPVTSPLLRRIGFRDTLIWNGVISAVLLAAIGAFRADWPTMTIYGILLVGGFVRSLQFTAYNTIAYADVPGERLSAATSLYSTIQQVSLTLGIAAGAAALELATALSRRSAPELSDYGAAFLVVGLVSLLAAPVATRLPADAGAELTGPRGRPL